MSTDTAQTHKRKRCPHAEEEEETEVAVPPKRRKATGVCKIMDISLQQLHQDHSDSWTNLHGIEPEHFSLLKRLAETSTADLDAKDIHAVLHQAFWMLDKTSKMMNQYRQQIAEANILIQKTMADMLDDDDSHQKSEYFAALDTAVGNLDSSLRV